MMLAKIGNSLLSVLLNGLSVAARQRYVEARDFIGASAFREAGLTAPIDFARFYVALTKKSFNFLR